MHGGIGMTWEYAGSHYAKRLIMIDHQLGDTEDQLRKVMALTDIGRAALRPADTPILKPRPGAGAFL